MTQTRKSPAAREHGDHTMHSDMLFPAVAIALVTILGIAFYIAAAGPSVMGMAMTAVVGAAITGAFYAFARMRKRSDEE